MAEHFLGDFTLLRPLYERSQEETLQWIAKAHARVLSIKNSLGPQEEEKAYQEIKEKIDKVGLGKDKIQKRGVQLTDFLHERWEEMHIYPIDQEKQGSGLKERMEHYSLQAFQVLRQFYKNAALPPHLIHVTCTGYASPSPAQKLVSEKGAATTVTHAYHMGCYASLPAIRMACGFCLGKKEPVDIVHTEMCSLHIRVGDSSMEQLVVQSLFADGFVKYSVSELPYNDSFAILALHEEIIPLSTKSMTWQCEDWGFAMTLQKDVPFKIAKALPSFVDTLFSQASVDGAKKQGAIFAIHPGGAKIIGQVAEHLHLCQGQVYHSWEALKNYGNMSSATLPHIWTKLLEDKHIAEGTYVVSLAFGPGLTISGSLFQKRSGACT